MTTNKTNIKCSICGIKIKDTNSNNASPINNGRCCHYCNKVVVVKARITHPPKRSFFPARALYTLLKNIN